ncbi:MAG: hypothetical protein JL50_03740 [Peptococcaceae bacterium BICA1-7]|nr:MAG: hypothetical protein JL50_03740 [Peptococcaceae bacterium BICA1-7]HBV97621.1 hypothetical protein [Desulfotomaculum sp.]
MGAVVCYSGKIYSYEDIEKAADFIEFLFGKNFFKSGVERIKDSDPSGAGMGREYSGKEEAKLFLAWHRVREELAFGGLDGVYRPGRYGALLGSLWEDLMPLSKVPGIEETAAGLMDNHAFEKTIFLLFVASRLFISQKDIIFPGNGLNCFYDQNYIYKCVFPAPGQIYPFYSPEEITAASQIAGCEDRQQLRYIDMTRSDKPLSHYEGILRDNSLLESGTLAAVLCKIEFPSGTAGYYRKVCCRPAVNEKTSGLSQAEGFLKLNLPD